jgi:hypothetical protein
MIDILRLLSQKGLSDRDATLEERNGCFFAISAGYPDADSAEIAIAIPIV